VLDAVCYTNAIAADIKPIHADVIVFTSPRNVAAYLDRYAPPETSHLVAIGGVTAAALYQRGYTVPFPETPSETAIAELLDRRGFL
jgi:uroporphyrinogen-III synthase